MDNDRIGVYRHRRDPGRRWVVARTLRWDRQSRCVQRMLWIGGWFLVYRNRASAAAIERARGGAR